MLKGKQLREFYPVMQYRDINIDLETIQTMISKLAKAVSIPVAFQKDEVSTGGILSANYESCLIMYHPNHQWDYFKFCIRVSYEGSYTFVTVNDFGESKQIKKLNKVENYRANRRGQAWSMVFNPAYTIGSMVGSAVGQGVTSIGINKHKIEEEQRYYQCIADILDELFVKEYDEDDPIWQKAAQIEEMVDEAVETEERIIETDEEEKEELLADELEEINIDASGVVTSIIIGFFLFVVLWFVIEKFM